MLTPTLTLVLTLALTLALAHRPNFSVQFAAFVGACLQKRPEALTRTLTLTLTLTATLPLPLPLPLPLTKARSSSTQLSQHPWLSHHAAPDLAGWAQV